MEFVINNYLCRLYYVLGTVLYVFHVVIIINLHIHSPSIYWKSNIWREDHVILCAWNTVNQIDNFSHLHLHQVYILYNETGQKTNKYMEDQMFKSTTEKIKRAKRIRNSEMGWTVWFYIEWSVRRWCLRKDLRRWETLALEGTAGKGTMSAIFKEDYVVGAKQRERGAETDAKGIMRGEGWTKQTTSGSSPQLCQIQHPSCNSYRCQQNCISNWDTTVMCF